MKDGGTAPRILDLGTRWSWGVSLTPYRFARWERGSGCVRVTGWVGLIVGLGSLETKESLDAAQNRAFNSWSFNSWPIVSTSLDVPAVFCS